jgi:ABC-type transporter Mla subunit MlaD
MTEERGIFLRVGLLILGGFALVAGLVWFFAGNTLRHGLAFESYFSETVEGLAIGAPVKYRGVTVGTVTELGLVTAEYGTHNLPVELDQQTYRMVFIRFVVDPARIGLPAAQVSDPTTAVAFGLRVRLASQGITGVAYVEVDFADPKKYPALDVPWTPRDPYIPSMPSTLLELKNQAVEFLATLNRLDLDTLITSVTAVVTDVRATLEHGDLHLTLERSAELVRTLNDAARAADLPGLTADFRRTSDALRAVAQDRDLHRVLANAAVASDHLAAASARLAPLIAALQSAAGRIDSGTADLQQGVLPILRDAQAAAANLRDTSEELRRYPPQFLLAEPPPRPRELPK